MRLSPRAGDATIFKKIASPSQAKNRLCSRGLKNLRSTIIFSSSAPLFHFNKEHAVHKGPPLTVVICDGKSIWLVFRIGKSTHESVTSIVYAKTAMFDI